MLVEFSVGNYRSFKERSTLSMVAANIISSNKDVDNNNTFKADENLTLLTSAAVYGANASGKSNLISAMRFMRDFVLNSSRATQIDDEIDVETFRLHAETESKPSLFEVVFRLENRQYRYGFEVTPKCVISEWLYHASTTKESRLFVRDAGSIKTSSDFKEGRDLRDKTRDNALFLSVVAQFNGKISKSILRWFESQNVSIGLNDTQDFVSTVWRLERSKNKGKIASFIKTFDIGIDNIDIEKKKANIRQKGEIPAEFKRLFEELEKAQIEQTIIHTFHRKYNLENEVDSVERFDLESNESEGTKKIFAISLPLLNALRNGTLVVIDEMDARLHPLITIEIVKLFNSKKTNPKNSQLIFATHDTNLLSKELFRRDQVWFAEKNRYGATSLFSLVEYKVRNDASFQKNYIQGRYGAIPFIGDFSSLIEEEYAETEE